MASGNELWDCTEKVEINHSGCPQQASDGFTRKRPLYGENQIDSRHQQQVIDMEISPC
jgi:hypothetical protein